MATFGHGIQYQLGNNASYSSLPTGLDVVVAPNRAMSPPEKTSRYTYKPLPPLPPPPGKASTQFRGHNGSSNSLDITTTRQISTFPVAKGGSDHRGSIEKLENLLGHKLDRFTRHPTLEELARDTNQGGPPQLPEKSGLSTLDHHTYADSFSDNRRHVRSESEHSLSSASTYSEDNTVEEIFDIYSKWGSRAPNSESPTSPVKSSVYLQPNMYSTSATELGHASHTSNVRLPNRANFDGSRISPMATTLAELVTEERERFGGYSRFGPGDRTTSFYDQNLPEVATLEYPPRNEDVVHRRDHTPQPLALRPKGFHDPHRSMSRWSDHSTDGGMISNARDSAISHIQNMSSPFKRPSRPSMVFKEKAMTSTIQVPPTEHIVRKRVFSRGKHRLKGSFPFRSPLHKKSYSDDSSTLKQLSFASRISDSFKHFSGFRQPPIIDSRIISNHARTGDGPDTPMPTKPGLMNMISPTAILFQKGTLQIQDALQKARHVARVKSRDERRRDKLRNKIVVVGTADPSPAVSRWL